MTYIYHIYIQGTNAYATIVISGGGGGGGGGGLSLDIPGHLGLSRDDLSVTENISWTPEPGPGLF